jgi:hypothetical protein
MASTAAINFQRGSVHLPNPQRISACAGQQYPETIHSQKRAEHDSQRLFIIHDKDQSSSLHLVGTSLKSRGVSGYRLLYPQFIDDRKVIIESLPQLSSRRGGDPPQSCCGLLPALGFVKKRVVVASALHRYFFPPWQSLYVPLQPYGIFDSNY